VPFTLGLRGISSPQALNGAPDQRRRPLGQAIGAKVADGNEAGGSGIAAGDRLPSGPAPEEDGDQVVRQQPAGAVLKHHFVDVEEAGDLGLDSGFLAHLAYGRGRRALSRLNMSARQTPLPLEGAAAPLDQQDMPGTENGSAGPAPRPEGVGARRTWKAT
jgi:hypothetical protein